MKRLIFFLLGFIILVGVEILRVYYIMPFPGSQHQNSIRIAYFLGNYIIWFRLLGLILFPPAFYYYFKKAGFWKKVLLLIPVAFYLLIFYAFNFRFLADKMFYQPRNKSMVSADKNKVDTNQLVIGISMNGEAKAYPIQIIGYHHQVKDTLHGQPIMVTYCTVCRTGRIFSPFVNNKYQLFRLVGMDHFNAMFEDEDTKSWWRQVNGEAIAGPLKGQKLAELPSAQMRLGAWIRENPGTLILQPDTVFSEQYADLKGFDSGTIKGSLEKRDSSSWKFKSWIVGISYHEHARAYDWNKLVADKVINDSLPGLPLVIVLENDCATFHVMDRRVKGETLSLSWDSTLKLLHDDQTHSSWSWAGLCLEGTMKGEALKQVQAYQEFWHSWQSFHPLTTQYNVTATQPSSSEDKP
ncbi:MAG: DUF3179 domain-containing (seleno)protein [Chitinophagales bacterium]